MENNQSPIYDVYLTDGTKVWINLNHVVTAHLIKPEGPLNGPGPLELHVTMINDQVYVIGNDLLDSFLFALNSFHAQ